MTVREEQVCVGPLQRCGWSKLNLGMFPQSFYIYMQNFNLGTVTVRQRVLWLCKLAGKVIQHFSMHRAYFISQFLLSSWNQGICLLGCVLACLNVFKESPFEVFVESQFCISFSQHLYNFNTKADIQADD